jgi:uncharacterized protein YndB with AHSA1/START domain
MLVFSHAERRDIAAPPEAVFTLIGDPARHATLAGSGEVKTVRLRGSGPTTVGSTFEADEEIRIGRNTQRFTAVSTIAEYEAPRVISWTSMPPNRPRPKRIQWWYELEHIPTGTRVTERVEVDLGTVVNVLMKLPYRKMRGAAVSAGMARTLENLDKAVTSGASR